MVRQRRIQASEDEYGIYDIEIGFAGMVGVSVLYNVEANNYDEAVDAAIEEAKNELEVTDVEDLGDGEYEVSIIFGGMGASETTYEVSAEDQDEAKEIALDEAEYDLESI